jgi:hypothetical protein
MVSGARTWKIEIKSRSCWTRYEEARVWSLTPTCKVTALQMGFKERKKSEPVCAVLTHPGKCEKEIEKKSRSGR